MFNYGERSSAFSYSNCRISRKLQLGASEDVSELGMYNIDFSITEDDEDGDNSDGGYSTSEREVIFLERRDGPPEDNESNDGNGSAPEDSLLVTPKSRRRGFDLSRRKSRVPPPSFLRSRLKRNHASPAVTEQSSVKTTHLNGYDQQLCRLQKAQIPQGRPSYKTTIEGGDNGNFRTGLMPSLNAAKNEDKTRSNQRRWLQEPPREQMPEDESRCDNETTTSDSTSKIVDRKVPQEATFSADSSWNVEDELRLQQMTRNNKSKREDKDQKSIVTGRRDFKKHPAEGILIEEEDNNTLGESTITSSGIPGPRKNRYIPILNRKSEIMEGISVGTPCGKTKSGLFVKLEEIDRRWQQQKRQRRTIWTPSSAREFLSKQDAPPPQLISHPPAPRAHSIKERARSAEDHDKTVTHPSNKNHGSISNRLTLMSRLYHNKKRQGHLKNAASADCSGNVKTCQTDSSTTRSSKIEETLANIFGRARNSTFQGRGRHNQIEVEDASTHVEVIRIPSVSTYQSSSRSDEIAYSHGDEVGAVEDEDHQSEFKVEKGSCEEYLVNADNDFKPVPGFPYKPHQEGSQRAEDEESLGGQSSTFSPPVIVRRVPFEGQLNGESNCPTPASAAQLHERGYNVNDEEVGYSIFERAVEKPVQHDIGQSFPLFGRRSAFVPVKTPQPIARPDPSPCKGRHKQFSDDVHSLSGQEIQPEEDVSLISPITMNTDQFVKSAIFDNVPPKFPSLTKNNRLFRAEDNQYQTSSKNEEKFSFENIAKKMSGRIRQRQQEIRQAKGSTPSSPRQEREPPKDPSPRHATTCDVDISQEVVLSYEREYSELKNMDDPQIGKDVERATNAKLSDLRETLKSILCISKPEERGNRIGELVNSEEHTEEQLTEAMSSVVEEASVKQQDPAGVLASALSELSLKIGQARRDCEAGMDPEQQKSHFSAKERHKEPEGSIVPPRNLKKDLLKNAHDINASVNSEKEAYVTRNNKKDNKERSKAKSKLSQSELHYQKAFHTTLPFLANVTESMGRKKRQNRNLDEFFATGAQKSSCNTPELSKDGCSQDNPIVVDYENLRDDLFHKTGSIFTPARHPIHQQQDWVYQTIYDYDLSGPFQNDAQQEEILFVQEEKCHPDTQEEAPGRIASIMRMATAATNDEETSLCRGIDNHKPDQIRKAKDPIEQHEIIVVEEVEEPGDSHMIRSPKVPDPPQDFVDMDFACDYEKGDSHQTTEVDNEVRNSGVSSNTAAEECLRGRVPTVIFAKPQKNRKKKEHWNTPKRTGICDAVTGDVLFTEKIRDEQEEQLRMEQAVVQLKSMEITALDYRRIMLGLRQVKINDLHGHSDQEDSSIDTCVFQKEQLTSNEFDKVVRALSRVKVVDSLSNMQTDHTGKMANSSNNPIDLSCAEEKFIESIGCESSGQKLRPIHDSKSQSNRSRIMQAANKLRITLEHQHENRAIENHLTSENGTAKTVLSLRSPPFPTDDAAHESPPSTEGAANHQPFSSHFFLSNGPSSNISSCNHFGPSARDTISSSPVRRGKQESDQDTYTPSLLEVHASSSSSTSADDDSLSLKLQEQGDEISVPDSPLSSMVKRAEYELNQITKSLEALKEFENKSSELSKNLDRLEKNEGAGHVGPTPNSGKIDKDQNEDRIEALDEQQPMSSINSTPGELDRKHMNSCICSRNDELPDRLENSEVMTTKVIEVIDLKDVEGYMDDIDCPNDERSEDSGTGTFDDTITEAIPWSVSGIDGVEIILSEAVESDKSMAADDHNLEEVGVLELMRKANKSKICRKAIVEAEEETETNSSSTGFESLDMSGDELLGMVLHFREGAQEEHSDPTGSDGFESAEENEEIVAEGFDFANFGREPKYPATIKSETVFSSEDNSEFGNSADEKDSFSCGSAELELTEKSTFTHKSKCQQKINQFKQKLGAASKFTTVAQHGSRQKENKRYAVSGSQSDSSDISNGVKEKQASTMNNRRHIVTASRLHQLKEKRKLLNKQPERKSTSSGSKEEKGATPTQNFQTLPIQANMPLGPLPSRTQNDESGSGGDGDSSNSDSTSLGGSSDGSELLGDQYLQRQRQFQSRIRVAKEDIADMRTEVGMRQIRPPTLQKSSSKNNVRETRVDNQRKPPRNTPPTPRKANLGNDVTASSREDVSKLPERRPFSTQCVVSHVGSNLTDSFSVPSVLPPLYKGAGRSNGKKIATSHFGNGESAGKEEKNRQHIGRLDDKLLSNLLFHPNSPASAEEAEKQVLEGLAKMKKGLADNKKVKLSLEKVRRKQAASVNSRSSSKQGENASSSNTNMFAIPSFNVFSWMGF